MKQWATRREERGRVIGSGTKLGREDHAETLLSAAEGESVEHTAVRWGCSARCVAGRRKAAIAWMGAENITHAVALAYQKGILHS
jgi:hypothetical protein